MWCSPTASPQTYPRVVFFPTSASGFRSSSRTSTLPLDLMAIVAAVMQPAMPAPTTTTSLSSNYNPLERLTAALLKPTLGFRSQTRRLSVKSLYYLRTGRSREKQGDPYLTTDPTAQVKRPPFLALWLRTMRVPFLQATFVPVVLGGLIAFQVVHVF